MECYECAQQGNTTAAVSICRNCGAGLCLEHTHQAAEYRVGGTVFGCPHTLNSPGLRPLGAVAGRRT
jgi:hypothetical protein